MKKEYIFKDVKYGFNPKFKKWQFTVGNFSTILSVKGGKEMADKISHLISAGWIRTKNKSIDNMARANINKVNAE